MADNTTKNDIPTYFCKIFDPTIRVGPEFFIVPLYVEINVSKNHATSLLSDWLRVKNENDLYWKWLENFYCVENL
jgi:hypothetical protein